MMMACTTTKQTVITPFCIEMWSQQMLALDSIKLITFKKQIFFGHNQGRRNSIISGEAAKIFPQRARERVLIFEFYCIFMH